MMSQNRSAILLLSEFIFLPLLNTYCVFKFMLMQTCTLTPSWFSHHRRTNFVFYFVDIIWSLAGIT